MVAGSLSVQEGANYLKKKHGGYGVLPGGVPGGVARTATFALNNATLPYVLKIADTGGTQKLIEDASVAKGVNLYRGKICHSAVAECHQFDFTQIDKLLG